MHLLMVIISLLYLHIHKHTVVTLAEFVIQHEGSY